MLSLDTGKNNTGQEGLRVLQPNAAAAVGPEGRVLGVLPFISSQRGRFTGSLPDRCQGQVRAWPTGE